MITISVVIPLFNKRAHIGTTLESVLAQTAAPDEILVIDDGSTDGGEKVVASMTDPKIRLIRQRNQGVAAARNRGSQAARGELIAFLDADDTWEPGFLEAIKALQAKFPLAGAFATAYQIVNPDGSISRPAFQLCQESETCLIENYPKAALTFPVWTSAVAVSRKVLEEVGGFPKGEYLGEDVDLWLRIALRYPIAWSGAYLATYRKDAGNRAQGVKRWGREPAVSRTAREALAAGLVSPEAIRDLIEYAAYFQLDAARHLLSQGDRTTALQLLEYARGTRRFAWDWGLARLMAALPGNHGPWLWKIKRCLKGLMDGVRGIKRWSQ